MMRMEEEYYDLLPSRIVMEDGIHSISLTYLRARVFIPASFF